MTFDYDVFISYPHISNIDDNNNYNGWVAKFHDRLSILLTNLLGRKARIWRDNRLQVGAPFNDEIYDKLSKSKVFLCVTSPAYIQSKWCLNELREFLRLANQSGNLITGEHSRIIPVVKTYMPIEQRPREIQNYIYKEFYKIDENLGGVPLEFGQESGERGYEDYKTKLDEVVWAIFNTVNQIRDESPDDVRKTVFLAETTFDKRDEYERIKNELIARGFTILPDNPLPKDHIDTYKEAVESYLRRSFLSIHLLGKSYGTILDGATESIIHLQNNWAAKHSKSDRNFKRLIWIPQTLEQIDERQKSFLEWLQNNAEAQNGAEVLIRLFEGFKTRMLQVIAKPKNEPNDNLIRVYLMCDKPDFDYIPYVGKYLYNKGYEVMQLSRTDETLQHHKSHLMYCDATLILYGKTHKGWVDERLYDTTIRVKGWGREEAILCRAIFITNPETEEKQNLFIQSAKLLPPCYEEIPSHALESSLAEFVNDIEQAFNN
ncbi:toll/interleukin-1 receptor domain-containing protein [Runella sp.]|uniref:toll/interleukin-1 receptor domain-containing protein n=1 Tax=Runella sp. TaxID=1960881 RepID=UPI003D0F46AC